MEFRIEDVEVKVTKNCGLAAFGETYTMMHKPSGLKVETTHPQWVTREAKLQAIEELKQKVEKVQ